jgi:hypothetical protein
MTREKLTAQVGRNMPRRGAHRTKQDDLDDDSMKVDCCDPESRSNHILGQCLIVVQLKVTTRRKNHGRLASKL